METMVKTSSSQQAFDKGGIDTLGPVTKIITNNGYAVTVQWDLTKFITSIPIANNEARTIAKAILEEKIEHRTSTPYHSQTIRGCEKNHKLPNEYVIIYINDARTD